MRVLHGLIQALDRAGALRRHSKGQTLVEYGLIISMVSVIVVLALALLGPLIANLFSNTAQNLQ